MVLTILSGVISHINIGTLDITERVILSENDQALIKDYDVPVYFKKDTFTHNELILMKMIIETLGPLVKNNLEEFQGLLFENFKFKLNYIEGRDIADSFNITIDGQLLI